MCPVQALRQAVRKFFPAANGRMSKAAACMFTNTPDQHFVIDLHPVHPEVCPLLHRMLFPDRKAWTIASHKLKVVEIHT